MVHKYTFRFVQYFKIVVKKVLWDFVWQMGYDKTKMRKEIINKRMSKYVMNLKDKFETKKWLHMLNYFFNYN